MQPKRARRRSFCVNCGALVRTSSPICRVCGREHDPKERLFRQFLLNHTRPALRGHVQDGLPSIFKNWLLSHLYGTVLVVAVVLVCVLGVLRLISPPPRRVDARPAAIQAAAQAAAERTEQP